LGIIFTIRDGRVVSAEEYFDRAEALEAAGVSGSPTSQENVVVVRALFETWNAGDMKGLRELYHPDVIVRAPEGWPEPGPFVGVVGRFIWHAAGRGPGADLEMTGVWTVRKGKVFATEFFWDHAEALEALGLSERDPQADFS
jgi:ketosteroid isomerase-like protein